MPTGACGINCDVCKLKLLDICSSCGSGKSRQAKAKLEAQKRIMGAPCPMLACAVLNRLEYCTRDCSSFPCDNFKNGPYPFSQGFLNMQERRRQQRSPALTPYKSLVKVPPEYWERVCGRDMQTLCNLTQAHPRPEGGLIFHHLQEDILVDFNGRVLKRQKEGRWEITLDPLLELLTLLYLMKVDSTYPLGQEIVGTPQLKEAHYFTGPHLLPVGPLVERYGNDLSGFKTAADYLEGILLEMANAAYRLLPFPLVPLYYLMWEGDEEFPPQASILFDRSIEQYLSASAIWMLVNMVCQALLRGPGKKM
jgi:hypothetical protein